MCLTPAEEVLEKKMVHAACHAFGSGQTQVLRHLSADLVISLNLSIFTVHSNSTFNLRGPIFFAESWEFEQLAFATLPLHLCVVCLIKLRFIFSIQGAKCISLRGMKCFEVKNDVKAVLQQLFS